MLLLMIWAALGAAAIGGAVGLLMPAPVYRLAVDEGYRSDCHACGEPLRWFDPRGRCWSCGARHGPPAGAPGAVAAVLCGVLAAVLGTRPELPPLIAVTIVGVFLGAVDAAAQRLPDIVVLPAVGAAVLWFGLVAAATGEWGNYGRALLAGLAYAGVYLVLALLPKGDIGLGDIKLGLLLGLCLGWFGWLVVVYGALLPWLVNAPVALVQWARKGSEASVPFGPAMLFGAYLTLVVVEIAHRALA
jgi:leader peptidase (prepilin peptidase)/N-methyltransferase